MASSGISGSSMVGISSLVSMSVPSGSTASIQSEALKATDDHKQPEGCAALFFLFALSDEKLGEALYSSAATGRSEVVKTIIASSRFKDIPINGECGLGPAFLMAAAGGHLQCLQAVIDSNRFKDIPVTGDHGLVAALFVASMKGHLACVQALMACNRFSEIPKRGLEIALEGAKREGRQDVIKLLKSGIKEEECVIL